MKQPHIIFKATAIASSVLLVSGLVAYKVGAFDSLLTQKQSVTLPPEQSTPTLGGPTRETPVDASKPTDTTPHPDSQGQPTPLTPIPPNTVVLPGPKSAPAFFPGSKSPGPILPPMPPLPQTNTPFPPK